MARFRGDLEFLLRRVALRLRRCDTPPEETLSVFAGEKKLQHDQPFTNIELADLLEGIASEREEQTLLGLRAVGSGWALTPQQMIDAARSVATTQGTAITVHPAFLEGLAEIAQQALLKQAAA